MRRLAAIVLLLATSGALAALLFGASAEGSSTARFDVIFDDARGLIGGQLVKVAGARAGTIDNVVVTPDFKARVEATIDSRFMPFHKDATCTIRPEGLIAENYVDCDPGTANSTPLQSSAGHPPTVPVNRTTEPVSLLDLFNMFNLPTRERFQAIVNELGIGTSGRGNDFNDILRRANPTLALARQAISILTRQRTQLAAIIDNTNTIAREASTHTASLQRFLDQAASLSTLTAAHRDALSQAIARLPGLLAAAQPALRQLDTVAVDGTPLLQQLHASVPALNQVSSDLGPFVKTAKPALDKLGATLKQGIPAIRDTTPVVRTLRAYSDRSLDGTLRFAALAKNLQRHGFVENFFSVQYYITAALARFDSTSHLLSILLVGAHNGACSIYATKPVPGCSAHYGSQAPYKRTAVASTGASRGASACDRRQRHCARGTRGRRRPPSTRSSTTPATGQQPQSQASSPSPTAPGASTGTPPAGNAVQQTEQTLQNLIGYLLK
jgi:phospholipid/cholesterol/gamma-HCH transport system substrate-binding protein